MEEFVSPRFEGIGNTIRKKRSQISRRPRPESLPFHENHDWSPSSSTTPSDDVSKVSSDENTGADTNSMRKDFNLNQCALRDFSTSRAEGEYPNKKIKEEEGGSKLLYSNAGLGDSSEQGRNGLNHKLCSEGVLAPANWKITNKAKGSLELQSRTMDHGGRNGESQGSGYSGVMVDEVGNENKVKKVKLKVGGVTRTIQTKSNSNGASGSVSSTKSARSSDAPRPQQNLVLQENSNDDYSLPPNKNRGLQGIPWKDFSIGSFSFGKEDSSMGKMPEKTTSGKQGENLEPVCKSKRMPKRRVLDTAFGEDDEDDEIRYLEKLKNSKLAAVCKDVDEEPSKRQRSISRVSKSGKDDENLEDFGSSRLGKDGKKSRSGRVSVDTDYEDELASDCEPEDKKKKKKPWKDFVDSPRESWRETTLTTRQRALLSGKDASSTSGASLIEFPNGLPPAPPRKQKEKLSEVEQQLKKTEAAQRRRMQVEKAAQESEAEAIRKILGQDSSRKKREDKLKKRREELAQEKAANELMLASSTIRWVMGPTGTVVTFPKDMGLPTIFDSKPCSYPPPREKCAGPTCSNPFKYRDSKSKLPLCSLQCYKAIHERMEAETAC
ncbi:hypothetical protein F0562_021483 [Nyssa sinensis]|uniref:INO80 complex subunit B-like conserved region domain-containing protein n=1 Tax=Nyssa sinensis TaxID=561372 RepID=A0A5J5BMR7_9ASTE|nr:hypothetical protein F0562_021483 [Nyssa sinensis]